ncbi:hypothetical protein [Bradyrhizobium sp. 21]|uniref:hypothetical protein n=1 Tax=Bradyrhizobium sp. 21 TaxID=2782666 RepID=UPI001FFA04CD|nr:hypothetical protein [Bradyrhizobium sp. 21]MCK1386333.1 hypothetical protein [Bradyrhizobium sp. 21]
MQSGAAGGFNRSPEEIDYLLNVLDVVEKQPKWIGRVIVFGLDGHEVDKADFRRAPATAVSVERPGRRSSCRVEMATWPALAVAQTFLSSMAVVPNTIAVKCCGFAMLSIGIGVGSLHSAATAEWKEMLTAHNGKATLRRT